MGTILKNGVSYSGTPITIDSNLNSESINPIQNKVVAENFASVDERLNEVESDNKKIILGTIDNSTEYYTLPNWSDMLLILSNSYGQGSLYYISVNTSQNAFVPRVIYQSAFVKELIRDGMQLGIRVEGATFQVKIVKL